MSTSLNGTLVKRPLTLIWQVDPYSTYIWERDWLSELLRKFAIEHVVDLCNEIVTPNAIVVTNGLAQNGIEVSQYLVRFGEQGLPVGVIHISDEFHTSPIDFYDHATFVYRNYLRRAAFAMPNTHYLPLGYKSGFTNGLNRRAIHERSYRWSFAGHVKKSRRLMLEHAGRIEGGYTYSTKRFADPEALSTHNYADLLANTVFALCPRGNVSVDTFRLYEALEAGAIPIVEDDGGLNYWRELADPTRFVEVRAWTPHYWRSNRRRASRPSYWISAYGKDFPCPRVYHWQSLEEVLNAIDLESTASRIGDWWASHKRKLADQMYSTILQDLIDNTSSITKRHVVTQTRQPLQ